MDHPDPPGRTDAELIEASLVHPRAFAALFERYAGPVHRYLVKRVGPQDAEDLVGETFVTAFRGRSSYDLNRSEARPWLFGIATNLSRHYWRTEARRQKAQSVIATPAISHDHSEHATSSAFFASQEGRIAQALAQLDDAHLDVLLLVVGPGLTYEETALALGIPVGTVRSRMSRARQRLRELLGDSGQYLDEEQEGPPTEPTPVVLEGTP
jgi:RNA polymerase sigma-70 factor (ECF subfamily)